MELGIKGRRALVTGASRGIGLAIARALAGAGVDVALIARDAPRLERYAAELRAQHGVRAVGLAGDLSTLDGVRTAASAAQAALGAIDILVNNAGAIPAGPLESLSDEALRQAWDLKLFGYVRMARELLPGMRERRFGRIVNVIGLAGRQPSAGYLWGGPANAALMNFTKGLAQAVGRDGIRVNAINPGPIATERWTEMMRVAAERSGRDLASLEASAAAGVPLGRIGQPDEVADLALFLCSERAGFLHGALIDLDGGLCAAL